MIPELAPGLYLNLPEEIYFGQNALGSSDLKTLLRAPADWWYGSRHNPDREEADDSKARILGRALHALMLEGTQAYEGRISVEPDPRDYPDLAKTTEDIKTLLTEAGVEFKAKDNKGELVRLAVEAGFGDRVWDHITAKHVENVQLFGKMPLSSAQDRALRHMAGLVEKEPTIGSALRQGIPEASVFFEDPAWPGILFRARLDTTAPSMTIDLKTLSNWKGRSIPDMARRQIEEFEYDIQRRFYDDARQWMRRFIVSGDIHVWHESCEPGEFYDVEALDMETINLLAEIANTNTWNWVWLFYQMRDDKAHKAPVVIPRWHAPEGEVYEEAGRKIVRALENYNDFVNRFGFEQPWCHIEETLELEDSDLGGLRFKTAY